MRQVPLPATFHVRNLQSPFLPWRCPRLLAAFSRNEPGCRTVMLRERRSRRGPVNARAGADAGPLDRRLSCLSATVRGCGIHTRTAEAKICHATSCERPCGEPRNGRRVSITLIGVSMQTRLDSRQVARTSEVTDAPDSGRGPHGGCARAPAHREMKRGSASRENAEPITCKEEKTHAQCTVSATGLLVVCPTRIRR